MITPQPSPATETQTDTVAYFWVATIEKRNGEKICCHAVAEATPGANTRASVFRDVLAFLENRHGEFVTLSFSLEPNEISAPQATG